MNGFSFNRALCGVDGFAYSLSLSGASTAWQDFTELTSLCISLKSKTKNLKILCAEEIMAEKDTAELVSKKAKDYFDQGFN